MLNSLCKPLNDYSIQKIHESFPEIDMEGVE